MERHNPTVTRLLTQHRHFDRNPKGVDFVVGDIHGEHARLKQALADVGFDRQVDRLFALGDLIDRGADSEGVLELLELDWFHSVFGNHEMMLLQGMDEPGERMLHLMNGGAWFQALSRWQQDALARRIRHHCSLAITVETDQGPVGLIHATAPANWHRLQTEVLSPQDWQTLTWDRDDFRQARVRPGKMSPVAGVKFTVHGHVSCSRAGRAANRCWIDTLYRGGGLTLLPLPQVATLPEP